MYTAQNGIYIGLDDDTLARLEEDGILKLPMNGQMIVLELTELEDPNVQPEEQPGVA